MNHRSRLHRVRGCSSFSSGHFSSFRSRLLAVFPFSAAMINGRMQEGVPAHVDVSQRSAASSQPRRPRAVLTSARGQRRMEEIKEQGNIVFEYAKLMVGKEAISHTVQSGAKIRLPCCFWRGCCRHCFHRVCTDAFRKSLTKALYLYIRTVRQGASTTCGMLGNKCSTQKRSKGGSLNRLKCPELGQLLYDWLRTYSIAFISTRHVCRLIL